MQTWRVQPFTVMALIVLLGLTKSWIGFAVLGSLMLLGALYPPLNLLDLWISVITKTRQSTRLYPKRFALGMGGSLLLLSGLSALAGWTTLAPILAGLTFVASGTLAAAGFCIGCWIYNSLWLPITGRKAA